MENPLRCCEGMFSASFNYQFLLFFPLYLLHEFVLFLDMPASYAILLDYILSEESVLQIFAGSTSWYPFSNLFFQIWLKNAKNNFTNILLWAGFAPILPLFMRDVLTNSATAARKCKFWNLYLVNQASGRPPRCCEGLFLASFNH